MTHFPQPHPQRRSPRVHLGGSILALVLLEASERAKGKLQTVSVTGGLLRMARALTSRDFVDIAFQTQSGPVHVMPEMLHTTQMASERVMQPLRFIAFGDDAHAAP